jgi:hypothetical protein
MLGQGMSRIKVLEGPQWKLVEILKVEHAELPVHDSERGQEQDIDTTLITANRSFEHRLTMVPRAPSIFNKLLSERGEEL